MLTHLAQLRKQLPDLLQRCTTPKQNERTNDKAQDMLQLNIHYQDLNGLFDIAYDNRIQRARTAMRNTYPGTRQSSKRMRAQTLYYVDGIPLMLSLPFVK